MAQAPLKLSREALLSLGSMEGAYDLPVVEKRTPKVVPKPAPAVNPWPGYAAAAAVSLFAYAIHYLPFEPFRVAGDAGVRRPVSAAILAMFVGAFAGNFLPVGKTVLEGAKLVARRVIPVTIALTGATLSIANAKAVGWRAGVVILATMIAAMLASWLAGQALGLWARTSVLIGAGTAICGNSAIIAAAPLIDAEDRDVMLSMGSINVLGLALMFVSPFAGVWLGFNDDAYGVWAGSTLHAVPQAVAAGFAFSARAGGMATLVKLVRVALLAPMLLILAFAHARSRKDGVTVHYKRLVPAFLWGFFALFVLNSLGWLPVLQFKNGYSLASDTVLAEAGNILLTLSMAAMGLEMNLHVMARVGGKAVVVGTVAAIVACAVSWALIRTLL
ncbi:MAG TPA: putative sulfate exporter family transporter [Bryobacteraceae bacterium]|nr:putative sulfate exporter family transporter [Bryobacteraceae bacterium]